MLRFFRRQRPVQESDFQELRENFELNPSVSHGVPRNVHRLAADSVLGLTAVITKQGYLELYTTSGNKRVLLKKLGSLSSFFDFVEGEKLLLVICAANPSSGLPEAYHLIDTDGNNPCSTTCRSSYLPQAKCFTIAELPDQNGKCLLTGNANGSLCVATLKRNSDQLDFTELTSIPELVPDLPENKSYDFTHIRASRRFIFCCFQNSFVVVLCAETRQLLKTVDLPSKFTAIDINEALQTAIFVSTEITDEPILLSTGIPECTIRRISNLTLTTQDEARIFALASELFDIRIVYEKSTDLDKRKATAVLLLCEHEIIAIDLMDQQYRCIPLNFLQCVDSSPITTIQVQTVTNKELLQTSANSQYSARRHLFGDEKKQQFDDEPRSLIFTGHQSGDIFIWDMANGDQRLLQIFKSTNYLGMCDDECADESFEEAQIEEDSAFSIEQTDYHDLNEESGFVDWLGSPSTMWKSSKSKRIQEIGLYDDRCEDDRLAVESFSYSDQLNLMACGLYGGTVIVCSTSSETNSTSHLENVELKFVNAKLAENDQSSVHHEPLRIQKFVSPKPHILCILPQTPIRTIDISETSGLIAVGCSTGIVVFDASAGKIIFSKNFLNYQGTQSVLAGEKPLNRLKTMKQTVRKTFRGRSLRMSRVGNHRPVERQVEFRDTKQPSNNGIKCIRFHESHDERSFMFAGTAHAVIYMFEFESNDSCYLCKEIRLSHCAPVIDINFIQSHD
ncbi:Lethal(2) giant larvae-like protein 2 [Aphelenchoides bicaudatus]|nr:Lethal(2) giant larvae-like protein 2 [Aphelenchoides bicaudatus]